MNKDEMKMIEDNKRKETEFETMTHFEDPSIPHICVIPGYRFGAETLYDANCRILAEDEIVIKKSEYEELTKTYAAINSEAYYCGLSVGKEETAREILQFIDSRLDIPRAGIFERKIYFKKGYKMAIQEIKMLIKAEYGIEEED